jgi:hypothetical protein
MRDKLNYIGVPVLFAFLGYTLAGILFYLFIYAIDRQIVLESRPFILLIIILLGSGLYFSIRFIKPKYNYYTFKKKILYPFICTIASFILSYSKESHQKTIRINF